MAVQAYFRNAFFIFLFFYKFKPTSEIGPQVNVINKLGFGNKKTAVSFW